MKAVRFVLNKDGTISPLMNPDLVLGLHPVLKDAQKEITETAEALEDIFKATRPDLLRYTQVFDDHLICKDQLKDLTVEMLNNNMKIPLGHSMAMLTFFKTIANITSSPRLDLPGNLASAYSIQAPVTRAVIADENIVTGAVGFAYQPVQYLPTVQIPQAPPGYPYLSTGQSPPPMQQPQYYDEPQFVQQQQHPPSRASFVPQQQYSPAHASWRMQGM